MFRKMVIIDLVGRIGKPFLLLIFPLGDLAAEIGLEAWSPRQNTQDESWP
jgi:hypothetical protein